MIEHLQTKYQHVNYIDYDNVKGPDWPPFSDFINHRQVPRWVYNEIDTMLFRKKPFQHPSFCVLPWYGLELSNESQATHCCLLPSNYDIHKIRSSMQAGQRPSECQKCWQLEDNNLISDRYLKNSTLDYYSNRDIELIMQQANEPDVLMLKIDTSSTCNGACIYCDSNNSSFWNTIERRINRTIPIRTYKKIDLDQLEARVDLSRLVTLMIRGGEPFLEKQNLDLMERLIALGNTQIFLSIVTNASVLLTKSQLQMLSQFKNLNLCLSIDAKDRAFEYQRWPLRWIDIEKNIDHYMSVTQNISVSCTVTNMSLPYYNDVIDWFRIKGLPWLDNPVYTPSLFRPSNLPIQAKKKLQDLLAPDKFQLFVGDVDRDPGQKWDNFLIEIQRQDRGKNIKIKEYLPEFCALVGI